VDVGGLGYEVQVPMTTLFQLPAPGETVTLLVHHAVREDAHTLYGFAAERDRELFRHLIRVTGRPAPGADDPLGHGRGQLRPRCAGR
jgi:Holliday junction DNA helicase RuvA